ncbi:MAG: hypothetical protein NTZ92_01170 [Candidatus Omnitrophica bacterium]|nr:hypothetical protein [Candidatus Omnitrophota bacterium]
MRKNILQISGFLALMMLPIALYAQPLSVAEIIKNVKSFDGKTITFEGEVIGDVMRRGNFAWVNVYNYDDALGVWMSASLAAGIDHTGSHRETGDKIEVVGVFHRACPEHGGDMDLHAQGLRRISCGTLIPNVPSRKKRNFIIFLLGAFIVLWIFTRSKRS